ncbi:hypothetical protein BKA62DRAFT_111396 [Auriculariales sp. MPI-PUGE-AT-0066]|nr:hypothetical protein BKA62DRAFT_111396 [Auriculariales sp. MPI-PUGE-AT-0066]
MLTCTTVIVVPKLAPDSSLDLFNAEVRPVVVMQVDKLAHGITNRPREFCIEPQFVLFDGLEVNIVLLTLPCRTSRSCSASATDVEPFATLSGRTISAADTTSFTRLSQLRGAMHGLSAPDVADPRYGQSRKHHLAIQNSASRPCFFCLCNQLTSMWRVDCTKNISLYKFSTRKALTRRVCAMRKTIQSLVRPSQFSSALSPSPPSYYRTNRTGSSADSTGERR